MARKKQKLTMSLIPYNVTRLYVNKTVNFQVEPEFLRKWSWKPNKAMILEEVEEESEWNDFKKLLSKSKGRLEAIILWKGGVSSTKLIIVDECITQESINYEDIKHEIQSLCNEIGVFHLGKGGIEVQLKDFLVSRGEIYVGYVHVREGYQSVEYCNPSEVKSIDEKIHKYPFLLPTTFGVIEGDCEDYESFYKEWNEKWYG